MGKCIRHNLFTIDPFHAMDGFEISLHYNLNKNFCSQKIVDASCGNQNLS